ncbi:MAG: N-methyl-D-aspartate receptor NMDAR2C subunit [Pseudomonadota bacterium]
MFDLKTFEASHRALRLTADVSVFHALQTAYDGSDRHYHNSSHVSHCLQALQLYTDLAERPAEIELAIWFHDAIYDTKASDNEERSAVWLENYLSDLNADAAMIARIAHMIRATKSHEADSDDARLMVDIDLGILGTSPSSFRSYDEGIRQEYHWVPDEVYAPARSQILSTFLSREQIYQTTVIRDRLEAPARRNLEQRIAELSA